MKSQLRTDHKDCSQGTLHNWRHSCCRTAPGQPEDPGSGEALKQGVDSLEAPEGPGMEEAKGHGPSRRLTRREPASGPSSCHRRLTVSVSSAGSGGYLPPLITWRDLGVIHRSNIIELRYNRNRRRENILQVDLLFPPTALNFFYTWGAEPFYYSAAGCPSPPSLQARDPLSDRSGQCWTPISRGSSTPLPPPVRLAPHNSTALDPSTLGLRLATSKTTWNLRPTLRVSSL